MRRFFAFLKKEFIHILRDTRTLMVLLIMPVIQIIIFGFALSTEINNIRFAVKAPDKDITTQRIVQKLEASSYFTLIAEVQTEEEISSLFRKGKIDIMVIFGNGGESGVGASNAAGSRSVQLIADASNTNVATMATYYASNIISSPENQIGETPLIVTNSKMLYNPSMKSSFTFVPGVMGMILMLICALMTSVAIVREKERGTMSLLLVSPARPFTVIVSKAFPYMIVSCVNLLTIILLSIFVLGVPVSGNLWGLILVSLIFIILALSLGILISTLANTQTTAMIVSGMVLMLPTMLLSGMLFPIESMPKILQWLSCIVPARWYISCVKTIMIQGLELRYCLKEILILIGFIIIYVGASLRNFKSRIQ